MLEHINKFKKNRVIYTMIMVFGVLIFIFLTGVYTSLTSSEKILYAFWIWWGISEVIDMFNIWNENDAKLNSYNEQELNKRNYKISQKHVMALIYLWMNIGVLISFLY